MVDYATSSAQGGPHQRHAVFLLSGPTYFGPYYAPSRLSVSKERELNREGNFCGGEDVNDIGSKNREIHVAGRLLASELSAFELLLDNDDPLDLTTAGWEGEVALSNGEYEGPMGFDPIRQERFYKYSLDLVSTGRDEDYQRFRHGIISNGEHWSRPITDSQLEMLEDGHHIGL